MLAGIVRYHNKAMSLFGQREIAGREEHSIKAVSFYFGGKMRGCLRRSWRKSEQLLKVSVISRSGSVLFQQQFVLMGHAVNAFVCL